jgi:hypothetical protein
MTMIFNKLWNVFRSGAIYRDGETACDTAPTR